MSSSGAPRPKTRLELINEKFLREENKAAETQKEKQERNLSFNFEPKPLVLFPDQEKNVDRDLYIFGISPVARNTSSTGLGKTENYFALAKRMGVDLWIICPSHMKDSVLRRRAKYSEGAADIEFIFSYYDTANSVKALNQNGELKLKLTYGNKKDGYAIADDFKAAVAKGVLIVFDEHHLTKNHNSARSQATGELIRYVVEEFRNAAEEDVLEQFKSRVYLCSATHIDKKSQTLNLLVNLGIVYGKLIQGGGPGRNVDVQNYMLLMNEAIRLAQLKDIQKKSGNKLLRQLNEMHSGALFEERSKGRFNVKYPSAAIQASSDAVMYDVARIIIFPLITSEMPPFIPRLTFNAFFDFTTRESEELYLDSLVKMMKAIGEDRKNRLKMLGEGLRMSQQACIPTAVDFLVSFLKEKPTNKACLVAKYLEGILDLAVQLFEAAGYRVLYMTGKTTIKQRDEILFKFQQANSNYRVLLFTTQLASGFDAHDLNGNFERRIVMFRDYSPTDIDQGAGRFYRRNMKSFGECFLFNSLRYGTLQARITEILTDKSQVLKDVSLDVFKKGLKRNFPGFYPRCFINGYIVEKKGKESIRHDILYLNEFVLDDENDNRMRDEELILKFIRNEPLPLVDAPLNFMLDAHGNKRAVDETFQGLDDIYWLNTYTKKEPMRYQRSVGTTDNPFDQAVVERINSDFEVLIAEYEAAKSKNKDLVIKIVNEDGDDVDDDIVNPDDLMLIEPEEFGDYEEISDEEYEEPEILTDVLPEEAEEEDVTESAEESDSEATVTASEGDEGAGTGSYFEDLGRESGEGDEDVYEDSDEDTYYVENKNSDEDASNDDDLTESGSDESL